MRTIAQKGYYTVDSSGYASSAGAVSEMQAPPGFYTVDADSLATDTGAVGVLEAKPGYFTVADIDGNVGASAGAVDVCQARQGYFTVDSSGLATNVRAVNEAPCAAGTISVSVGLTVCKACPSGEFATGSANWQCTLVSLATSLLIVVTSL